MYIVILGREIFDQLLLRYEQELKSNTMSSSSDIPSTSSLIQNEEHNDINNENVVVPENPEETANDNIVCCCDTSTRKFCSLAYMAVALLLGVVFLVAGKVKTDRGAIHISEDPVYCYLTLMLFVAILWMSILIFQKRIPEGFREKWLSKHEEPEKQLIPIRLLVGIMFFGLGSSFMTMVELLEYSTGYDCPSGGLTKPFYYSMRTIFIYAQLYFFYKLSSRSKKVLFCSHFLVMHLIAVNLGTWIVTFVHESSEEMAHDRKSAQNTNSTAGLSRYMAQNWGVILDLKNQSAANISKQCLKTTEDLKSTAENMAPYFYTFTMEYCLISAGLLLNVWLSLRKGVTEESNDNGGDNEADQGPDTDSGSIAASWELVEAAEGIQEVGTLWRFGFIFGLVYVPVFAAIIFNIMFTDTVEEDNLIYVGFQFFFFASILVACVIGCWQLGQLAKQNRKKNEKEKQEKRLHSKVDFYLLAGALVGVFFLDMFIIIASICELGKSPPPAVFLIITNITELLCSVAFTLFVHKALESELPSEKDEAVLNSASVIREIVSFLFMLNFCFWAMYTFEVKKSGKVVGLVVDFYHKSVWFYISHFVYPLAVFFHFHGAVCMVEILNIYSKVPVRGRPLTPTTPSTNQGPAPHSVAA